jgi:hypothetical protein
MDYYLPGFKACGPISSVSQIIEIEDKCEFRVVTRNYDLGESEPFPDLKPIIITTTGTAQEFYMRKKPRDWRWML